MHLSTILAHIICLSSLLTFQFCASLFLHSSSEFVDIVDSLFAPFFGVSGNIIKCLHPFRVEQKALSHFYGQENLSVPSVALAARYVGCGLNGSRGSGNVGGPISNLSISADSSLRGACRHGLGPD